MKWGRDVSHGLSRLIQDRGWRRFRRAAVEGRFRPIDHMKLDRPGRFDAAQFRDEPQRAVDPRRHPGGEGPASIDHDALVHGNGAEQWQQVERSQCVVARRLIERKAAEEP